MSNLLKEAKAMAGTIRADRHYLHEHAETEFDLTETCRYVFDALTEMGYTPERCGKAGIVAFAGGKRPGKVFLLRADMDALPICEQADVPFASKNGRMHACGHDLHTAMLLGAARLLKTHEAEICGTVKLMFQPAEEVFEGSKDMIENGLLENPKVDAAMMIHVTANVPFEPGTVIVSAPGISAPAADYFTIRVQGKGCHGSAPNNGIDPLTAAAHILIALQEIQARELALTDQAVLTIGTMHAGGASNVIPDMAEMGGTIRTYDEETRAQLKTRMTEIAQGVAGAFRAKAEVTFGSGCPTLTNDKALCADAERYVRVLLGEGRAFTAAQLATLAGGSASKSAGSEDFAYVSHAVPSVMLALAAGQPEKGHRYPQHHPQVTFDEDALPCGAAVYAACALGWLREHTGS